MVGHLAAWTTAARQPVQIARHEVLVAPILPASLPGCTLERGCPDETELASRHVEPRMSAVSHVAFNDLINMCASDVSAATRLDGTPNVIPICCLIYL